MLACAELGRPQVLSGCLKPRIDTQRRLVVGNRSVEIALAAEGRAAVVVGVGEGWVKLDRAVVVGDSAAQIALGLVRVAAIDEKIRPRGDPNRLVPYVRLVTDDLRSYGAAARDLTPRASIETRR